VTTVEKALGIPHAPFDRNYRHLTEDFRQRATAARLAGPVSTCNDPGQVVQRLRREMRTSAGSSRSTPTRYASSPWTTSNSAAALAGDLDAAQQQLALINGRPRNRKDQP
jgi:hypothetical protein